jgi:uncharacterized protein YggE
MILNRHLALVLLLAFAPLALAEDDDEQPPLLTVSGEGEVQVPPDRAIVRFGVVAQSEEAAAAQEQVNELAAEVIDEIKDAGVADKHIQTTNLSLQPIYDRGKSSMGPDNVPRIRAYRASYTVTVTVERIDNAGNVIDAGLGAGANQFHGIQFTLKDDAAARQTALQKAAADARAKAKTISEAMGVGLVGVQSIDEGVSFDHPRPRHARAMAAEADAMGGGVSVQPGQLTVRATLTVRYRIQ